MMWKYQTCYLLKNVPQGVDPLTGEVSTAAHYSRVSGKIVPSGPQDIASGFVAGSYAGYFKLSDFREYPVPERDWVGDSAPRVYARPAMRFNRLFFNRSELDEAESAGTGITNLFKIKSLQVWTAKNLLVLELVK